MMPLQRQIRPLASSDYHRGHLSVLQALTDTPDPGQAAYVEQFQLMKTSKPMSYFVLAIVSAETDKVVAVGSLFLECKFIRNLGSAGHIEDIAVDTTVQGKGLGKKMINALTLLSESLGAYKVILDCSTDNQGERDYSLSWVGPFSSRAVLTTSCQCSLLRKVWVSKEGEFFVQAPSDTQILLQIQSQGRTDGEYSWSRSGSFESHSS